MFKDENLDGCDTFMRATDARKSMLSTNTLKRETGCSASGFSGASNPITKIYGHAENRNVKKAEKDARIERIKQVREQEKQISRHGKGNQYREELKKDTEEKQICQEYAKFLQMQKTIEELKTK